MENQEQQFIKGFNVGYQLNKNDPALLSELIKSKNDHSDYFKAIVLGAKQYDREVIVKKLQQTKDNTPRKDRSR